jgi:spermidine/putrescine transport system ATP-binding protein
LTEQAAGGQTELEAGQDAGPASAVTSGDLVLTGVTKKFGSFVAVDDLDLTVPAGSFFALLGPSGCGKTTTLRMIAGLETPTVGKITLAGGDITSLKPYRRPVNTVFQSYALFPHMTISENVAFGLKRTGAKDVKSKVADLASSRQFDACCKVSLR